MLFRNTYLEINLKSIEKNVRNLMAEYYEYKHHIGVVKADCYGQSSIRTVKAVIKGGCDYLAVATLDEALDIRKKINEIPILCLGVVPSQYMEACLQNNITITINSLEYLQEVLEQEPEGLKVHLKIDTGMHRLGIEKNEEVLQAVKEIKKNGMKLEGIYTHIYQASSEEKYLKQIEKFEEAVQGIDLTQIPIVHIAASEALANYEKPKFMNGCRLGLIMYGLTKVEGLRLDTTARLISEVIQVHTLQPGETVGYEGAFKAEEETKIAVVGIGYADGVIRKNTGRDVYINGNRYPIVGNICMDMLFVKVDDDVEVHDTVYVLKDNAHIEEVAQYLDTIPYEVLCMIGKRVPRVCKD